MGQLQREISGYFEFSRYLLVWVSCQLKYKKRVKKHCVSRIERMVVIIPIKVLFGIMYERLFVVWVWRGQEKLFPPVHFGPPRS